MLTEDNESDLPRPVGSKQISTYSSPPALRLSDRVGPTDTGLIQGAGLGIRAIRHVVLLHGFGSRGADLAQVARRLTGATGVPTSIPDAPRRMNGGPRRFWFPLEGLTEENRPDRVANALPDVLRIVRDCVGSEDLHDVALGGFSQGAVLSLEAFATGVSLGAVLAFSGRFAGDPISHALPPTPVLIAHGGTDPVVAVTHARQAAAWLNRAGQKPILTIEPFLGHTIGPLGLKAAIDMIGRLPAPALSGYPSPAV